MRHVADGRGVERRVLRDEVVERVPVAPRLPHRARLRRVQRARPGRVGDEPVRQPVGVLVVEDRRVVPAVDVAEAGVAEQVHLHQRRRTVRRRGHVRVVDVLAVRPRWTPRRTCSARACRRPRTPPAPARTRSGPPPGGRGSGSPGRTPGPSPARGSPSTTDPFHEHRCAPSHPLPLPPRQRERERAADPRHLLRRRGRVVVVQIAVRVRVRPRQVRRARRQTSPRPRDRPAPPAHPRPLPGNRSQTSAGASDLTRLT